MALMARARSTTTRRSGRPLSVAWLAAPGTRTTCQAVSVGSRQFTSMVPAWLARLPSALQVSTPVLSTRPSAPLVRSLVPAVKPVSVGGSISQGEGSAVLSAPPWALKLASIV